MVWLEYRLCKPTGDTEDHRTVYFAWPDETDAEATARSIAYCAEHDPLWLGYAPVHVRRIPPIPQAQFTFF